MRTVAHEDVALGDWVAAVSAARTRVRHLRLAQCRRPDVCRPGGRARARPSRRPEHRRGRHRRGRPRPRLAAAGPGFDIVVHLIKVSGEPGPGHVEGRLLRTR